MDNIPYNQPKVKRRAVNRYGEIVTADGFFQDVYDEIEHEDLEKAKKKAKSKKKNEKTTKKAKETSAEIEKVENEEDLAIEEETEEEITLSSSDEDMEKENQCPASFPTDWEAAKKYLQNTWESMNTPVPEKDLQDEWFAAIYYGKKNGTLYIGRLTKRFLTNAEGTITQVELDCLKPAVIPSTTDLEEPPAHLGKDYGIFPIHDIIAGFLPITYISGRKWKYMDYPKLFKLFKLVEKQPRDTIKII